MNGTDFPPLTLPRLVLRRAASHPDATAMRQKTAGGWTDLSWREYAGRATACAAGLIEVGLGAPGHVAIFAEGRVEWVIAQTAVGLAGGVVVGCYPTSSTDDLRHALGHADVQVVICENRAFLDKVDAVRADLPNLTHVVLMEPDPAAPGVLAFEAVEQLGRQALANDPGLLDRVPQAFDDVALMVYTSGSTGAPKAALLTWRNMRAAAQGFVPILGLGPESVILSYLPLCHIAEQSMTNIGPLFAGATACFGGGLPTLLEDLRAVRPTYFSGVPRVWQKLQAEIAARFAAAGRSAELDAALDAGRPLAFKAARLWDDAEQSRLAPHLALMAEARAMVGLDRATAVTSGAAPLHVDTLSFLRALGFPLLELYGMTEACSVMTIQRPDAVAPGGVGRPVDTVELRLADDAEILVRGENVFAGYYRNPEATALALEDGWLHTGDIGAFDGGQLRIVDRKKDIMITEGGKNIAPAEVEGLMRSSDLIAECVLVADRRNYVAALIQIDPAAFGAAPGDLARLARDPAAQGRVGQEIRRLNETLARVAQVKRAHLLDEALSHGLGDLTPTLKLRRFKVHQRYRTAIDQIYAGEIGFDIYPRADAPIRSDLRSAAPAEASSN